MEPPLKVLNYLGVENKKLVRKINQTFEPIEKVDAGAVVWWGPWLWATTLTEEREETVKKLEGILQEAKEEVVNNKNHFVLIVEEIM